MTPKRIFMTGDILLSKLPLDEKVADLAFLLVVGYFFNDLEERELMMFQISRNKQ